MTRKIVLLRQVNLQDKKEVYFVCLSIPVAGFYVKRTLADTNLEHVCLLNPIICRSKIFVRKDERKAHYN